MSALRYKVYFLYTPNLYFLEIIKKIARVSKNVAALLLDKKKPKAARGTNIKKL